MRRCWFSTASITIPCSASAQARRRTSLHEHRRPYCRAVLCTRRRRLGRSCTRQLDLCPPCPAAALSPPRRPPLAPRRATPPAPAPPYRTSGPDALAPATPALPPPPLPCPPCGPLPPGPPLSPFFLRP